MDETGHQPGGEPARANGTGVNGTGVNGAGGGGARLEANGAVRPAGATRTADQGTSPFSPAWNGQYNGAQPFSRYDMLAPVSPAVPASAPMRPYEPEAYEFSAYEADSYEEDREPVAGEDDRDDWSAPWIPGERQPSPLERMPVDQDDLDRPAQREQRLPGERGRHLPQELSREDPDHYDYPGYRDYRLSGYANRPSPLDDLPTLAQATAASQAAQAEAAAAGPAHPPQPRQPPTPQPPAPQPWQQARPTSAPPAPPGAAQAEPGFGGAGHPQRVSGAHAAPTGAQPLYQPPRTVPGAGRPPVAAPRPVNSPPVAPPPLTPPPVAPPPATPPVRAAQPLQPGLPAPPAAVPAPREPQPRERDPRAIYGPHGPSGAFLLASPPPGLASPPPGLARPMPAPHEPAPADPLAPMAPTGRDALVPVPLERDPYHAPSAEELPGAAEAAAQASASARAAREALSAARAAHARAAAEDLTAVEAAYAAAVDAGGELSDYPPEEADEFAPPRRVPGGVLPQRVPAAPDVPEVPDDEPEYDYVEHEPAPTPLASPELARIATRLRSEEDAEQEAPGRPDGFDMDAVLAAVRVVEGVRGAQLRPNPNGVHTLRLDLADGADGARVSREVARLLKERMGLAAEPRRAASGGQSQAPGAGQPPAGEPGQSPSPSEDPNQPRDTMPVAGAAPAPRIPMPASAAENLGGPAAANATSTSRGTDERGREGHRRHAVSGLRGRAATTGYQTGEHPQATPPLRRSARPGEGSRVVLDQVQVNTLGLDATVIVRLLSAAGPAEGRASGPAVDGYVLRLAAVAAASAIDQLLSTVDTWEQQRGRCFVEHAAVVPLGSCEVAVVVVLLVCGGWVEQLSGAALVNGDPRQAIVRATLAAVNRRLDGLLG